MGYMANNLATVVCGVFAAVLTALWVIMTPTYPVLHFVFLMAVPIMWFLVFMCWIVQAATDYSPSQKSSQKPTYTSDGKIVNK